MTAISSPGRIGFLGAGLLQQQAASPTVGFVLLVVAMTLGAAIVAAAALIPSNRARA